MRVAVPHNLDKAEVRRRLQSRSGDIAGALPGNVADVRTDWPGEDRMTLAISAMGQEFNGAIDIEVGQVFIEFDLPPALSFMEGMVEKAVKQQGQKLLAPWDGSRS